MITSISGVPKRRMTGDERRAAVLEVAIAEFARTFPGAAVLVTGVVDPASRWHGIDESLHLEMFARVVLADVNPLKIESDLDDDHFVYLSDVMPTAWQALEYAAVREGETLLVIGLGPIGDMAARFALHRGIRA